jgi:hypothetical protein
MILSRMSELNPLVIIRISLPFTLEWILYIDFEIEVNLLDERVYSLLFLLKVL